MSNPFEKVLGVTPEPKVLELFLPFETSKYQIDFIQEFTGIKIKKLRKIIRKFMKWNILIETKSPIISTNSRNSNESYFQGCEYFYTVNLESPLVKAIQAFNNAMIEEIIGEEGLYEIHDYLEEHRDD